MSAFCEDSVIRRNKSLSAVEILKHCPEYSNVPQQFMNDDMLMQVIKQRLNNYNSHKKSLSIDKDDSIFTIKHNYTCPRPGRLSLPLINSSFRRRTKNYIKNIDKNTINENLKKIGIRKSRRTLIYIRRKGEIFNSTEIDNASVASQPLSPERITLSSDMNFGVTSENQEKDPLAPSPHRTLKGKFEENLSLDEKLIITPVKAKQHSINLDVEYDRVYESINNSQTEQNFTLDGVQFLDNMELIDEILDEKVIANLMSDDNGRDKENLSSERVGKLKNDKSNYVRATRQGRNSIDSTYSPSGEESEDVGEIVERQLSEPLSGDVIEKLRMVEVNFEHKVPPQHEIEKSTLWKPLKADEKQRFLKYSELKEGYFDPEEDEILRNNWKRFCEIHELDIPNKRFFKTNYGGRLFIKSRIQRHKFIQFLANGLPCRSLRAVFQRFKILFGYDRGHAKKRYTESDDERIEKYMESREMVQQRLPFKEYAKMAQYFQRPYASILHRYSMIKKKKERDELKLKKAKDVVWTLELMETFLKHLIDLTMSEHLSDLKDSVIPAAVWKKLQDKMKIEFSALKSFWLMQFHPQLFSTRPIFYNEIKIMIIEYMYQRGIVDIRDMDWSAAVKYFDGFTTNFLRKICPRMKDNGNSRSYGDLIEELYERKIPILKIQQFDSYLPRLAYLDGKLEVIDDFPSA